MKTKIETVKQKLANQLTMMTESYSTQTKKWTLALAGLVCGIICISVAVLPFIKPKTTAINATMPVVIRQPQNEPVISTQELEQLEGFVRTMDSLKQIDNNSYQKALAGREGLMDSVLFLIRYYGQQMIDEK